MKKVVSLLEVSTPIVHDLRDVSTFYVSAPYGSLKFSSCRVGDVGVYKEKGGVSLRGNKIRPEPEIML